VARYTSSTPTVGLDGDVDALSLWAGQSVALATRVQPAAEIVRELVSP
jgi:NAD(P)H-dependent flavin oxidoreductase YrpB (nitropropane dioxygenase family)